VECATATDETTRNDFKWGSMSGSPNTTQWRGVFIEGIEVTNYEWLKREVEKWNLK